MNSKRRRIVVLAGPGGFVTARTAEAYRRLQCIDRFRGFDKLFEFTVPARYRRHWSHAYRYAIERAVHLYGI